MADKENTEKAYEHFGFGDAPEGSEDQFPLLPEGEAFFTIKSVKKERGNMGKFGECNIAVVEMQITTQDGQKGIIFVNLILVKDMIWRILQLATATGLRKHGDSGKVDPSWWAKWAKGGMDGRCILTHSAGKKAGTKFVNVDKFVGPDDEYTPPKKQDALEF